MTIVISFLFDNFFHICRGEALQKMCQHKVEEEEKGALKEQYLLAAQMLNLATEGLQVRAQWLIQDFLEGGSRAPTQTGAGMPIYVLTTFFE